MRGCAVQGSQEQCAGCCAASFEDREVPGLILELNTNTQSTRGIIMAHMNLWFSLELFACHTSVVLYIKRALGAEKFVED